MHTNGRDRPPLLLHGELALPYSEDHTPTLWQLKDRHLIVCPRFFVLPCGAL